MKNYRIQDPPEKRCETCNYMYHPESFFGPIFTDNTYLCGKPNKYADGIDDYRVHKMGVCDDYEKQGE